MGYGASSGWVRRCWRLLSLGFGIEEEDIGRWDIGGRGGAKIIS